MTNTEAITNLSNPTRESLLAVAEAYGMSRGNGSAQQIWAAALNLGTRHHEHALAVAEKYRGRLAAGIDTL
jgi:hypothetical protein